ncbi:hypothetical protein P0D69_04765 [Paraburkholderia sediminicola]|uniref:hypothetical protein n=1 Tax=Paraburkholderia sediminicola TaxID=458836 RepID=UPI0038B6C623
MSIAESNVIAHDHTMKDVRSNRRRAMQAGHTDREALRRCTLAAAFASLCKSCAIAYFSSGILALV